MDSIKYENINKGFYWGKWNKNKSKIMVTVYGVAPFHRVDVWEPSWGKTGVHIDNVDVGRYEIEFVKVIDGEWEVTNEE